MPNMVPNLLIELLHLGSGNLIKHSYLHQNGDFMQLMNSRELESQADDFWQITLNFSSCRVSCKFLQKSQESFSANLPK